MASEKKVIFSGQDNVSQKAQQIYNNILSNAKKHSDSLKEQNGYINSQIKSLEQKANIESKNALKAANANLKDIRGMAPGLDKNKAFIEYHSSKKNAETSFLQESKTIEILKNLLAETKKQATTSEKAEKSQQRIRLSSEDQYRAVQSLAKQEFRENKQGVIAKIKAAEKSGYEGMDPYAAQKLMFQKTLLGDEKKTGSTFGAVFAGTLAAGIATQLISALSKLTSASSGEQGVNTLLGGIPLVGGLLGGASGRTFEEQLAIQTKELELGAKTGSSVKGLSDKTNLGYSTRETLGMIESLISASGSSKGAGSASNALTLQRGLGLSQDVITQIVKDLRTTRSSADIMQIASDVLAANPELRKDQTKFAEILQQTSQLTNQLASQTEKSDPRRNAGLVGALRSIGGSFADPVLGVQRMMSINQALTSPGTDYQKSRSFGVLSGANPGASYFQILEAQEKGIGSKGYLGGLLKQLRRETGGGEEFMLGVNQNLGLKASTSRKLVEAFEKNPKMFDNLALGGKDGIEKVLGISGRAEAATSQRDKEKAEIDNAFSMSATAGTLKVASLTFEAAVDMFKETVVSINNTLSNASGKMGTQAPSKKFPNGKNVVNVMKMGNNGILIDANGETSE